VYAIVSLGSQQYRVSEGDVLDVHRLSAKEGSRVSLKNVLLIVDGNVTRIGQPVVKKASVVAEVVEHRRGPKVIVGKLKRRKGYRRKRGHRQALTRLRIKQIRSDKEAT
jgi:large subunit ribosomal protein L21